MSSELEMPWECVETNTATGRKLWKRTESFENTGNNEGTMSDGIRVTGPDDTELLRTSMHIDWEYFGSITAAFIEDGAAVRITGSDGQSEVHQLDKADPA